ncbi:MAG: hypothetical protein ACRDVK_05710, partial [Acidimicrobiia bacterium]
MSAPRGMEMPLRVLPRPNRHGIALVTSLLALVGCSGQSVAEPHLPSVPPSTLTGRIPPEAAGAPTTKVPTTRVDTSTTSMMPSPTSTLIGSVTAAVGADAFVAPSAVGSGDGSSVDNAAAISRLNSLIARVGPGGVIEISADAGPYTIAQPIGLSAGGMASAPVTIRGPLNGSSPELRGLRESPYSAAGEPGRALFRLDAGANHLVFRGLSCVNAGNGCFHVAAPLRDLAISDVTAANVQRFFENRAGQGQADATIDGLVISNVRVSGFSKGAIRIGYNSHDIELAEIIGDSQRQDGDNFAIGIHLVDSVHDVSIERVSMDNARDTIHEYWNGDGFAAEENVYQLHLIYT